MSSFIVGVIACVFLCLSRLLRLYPLWLVCYLYFVRFICVFVYSAMLVLGHLLLYLCLHLLCLYLVYIFYSFSAIHMPRSSAPSVFFVACRLSLPHLLYLRLRLQCYSYVESSAAPSIFTSAVPMPRPRLL